MGTWGLYDSVDFRDGEGVPLTLVSNVRGFLTFQEEDGMRLLTGGVLISIFLIPLMGCPPPVMRGGDAVTFAQPDGLPNPPGNNETTRTYFRQKIGFGNLVNDGTDVSFRSGTKVFRLRVDPENRAHEVDWFLAARDSYRGGSIVAKIKNVDNVDIDELGLKGKNDVVYIWVGPIEPNYAETGIAFYKFDSNGNGTRAGTAKFYTVLRCKDSYNLRPSAKNGLEHDIEKCSRTVLGPKATAVRAEVQPGVQLASYGPTLGAAVAGGLWISCSGGCCDVGGGSFF